MSNALTHADLSAAARSLGVDDLGSSRLLAVGWATVELERAERDFVALGVTFVPAPGSIHLGAACRVGTLPDRALEPGSRSGGTQLGSLPVIVLLEPTTEGRLSATLARNDEGWTAVWLEAGPPSPRAHVPAGDATPSRGPGEDVDLFGEGRHITREGAGSEPAPGRPPALSAERPGPLGPERLVLGSPIYGPHRLIVTAATIDLP